MMRTFGIIAEFTSLKPNIDFTGIPINKGEIQARAG